MKKRDIYKELKEIFCPDNNKAVQVKIQAINFLISDGKSDPNKMQNTKDVVETFFQYPLQLNLWYKMEKVMVDYL